ncbi:MAG: hypothetical protein J7M40_07490 [Planctomycetes bacterium]|nr:hypothetical protein [Planctomycetota bacterium]
MTNKTKTCSKRDRLVTVTALVFLGALIVGWIVHECFGHILIEAIYDGKGPETLQNLIQFQHKYPVEHYQQIGDGVFFRLTLMVSVCFGMAVVLYRLVFSEKAFNVIWLVFFGMAILVMMYFLNPNFRVYSKHGLFRCSIVYQILNGSVPPGDPYFAGYPAHYPWGTPWLVAMLSRIFNITPFYSYAAVNVVSLGLVIFLVHRISRQLINNHKANLFSAVIAIFGTTVFSRKILTLLGGLLHLAHAENKATPAFWKFSNLNAVPIGLVFFFLFVYALIRLFQDKRPWLFGMVIAVSLAGCGFFYVAFLPGMVAAVLAICFLRVVLGGTGWFGLSYRPLFVLLLVSVVACLSVGGYVFSTTAAVGQNVQLFNIYAAGENMANFLVGLGPLLVLIFVCRRWLLKNLDKQSFAIVLAIAAATTASYFFVHSWYRGEYKFYLLAAATIGIVGGVALYAIGQRLPMIVLFILLLLCLYPSYADLSQKLKATGNAPLLYYKRGIYFEEKGIDIHVSDAEEDAFYQWIKKNTTTKSAFIDTQWKLPVFARRGLWVALDRPDDQSRMGYGLTVRDLDFYNGYDQALYERRKTIADGIFGRDHSLNHRQIADTLAGKDLYIVERCDNIGDDLAERYFEALFTSSQANFRLYRVKPVER